MRLRIDLGNIDYARELHRLTGLGASQHDLASALLISQSGLAAALTAAHQVLPTRPGFSGASPYELCQRFAAGRLSRAQLLDELTRWDYTVAAPHTVDTFDDPRVECQGTIDDIDQAFDDDLINDAIYNQVLDAVEGPQP